MASAARGRGRPVPALRARSETAIRVVLVALGSIQFALGLWQAISPGTFFWKFAGYGTENVHYIRDISTFYVALGVALLVAASRPSWRAPVLFFATVQYGAHAVNHILDVGEAKPYWVGPANLVLIGLAALVFAYVLRAVWKGQP